MEEYQIRLNKDAISYALTTLRHVLLPLMEPVKKELQRMENDGVTKIPRFVQSIKKVLVSFLTDTTKPLRDLLIVLQESAAMWRDSTESIHRNKNATQLYTRPCPK